MKIDRDLADFIINGIAKPLGLLSLALIMSSLAIHVIFKYGFRDFLLGPAIMILGATATGWLVGFLHIKWLKFKRRRD